MSTLSPTISDRILFGRPDVHQSPPPDPLTTPLGRVVGLFVAGFEHCRDAGLEVRLSSRDAGAMVFSSVHDRVAIHLCHGTGEIHAQLARNIDQVLSLLVAT